MAPSITTNADIVTMYPTIESELERLSTQEMRDTQWGQLHRAAWTKILTDLSRQRPAVDESDLSDTSEFKPASIYYVMHLAYSNAELDADGKKAKHWYDRYREEMNELTPTLGGGQTAPNAYCVRTFRG